LYWVMPRFVIERQLLLPNYLRCANACHFLLHEKTFIRERLSELT
jgi:hypothetical protein